MYQPFHQLSFAVYIPMVFIYKFCIQDILIQPPWGPREHQLDEAHSKKLELHKISYKTKWPKGSIYSSAYLRKWQKKRKLHTLKRLKCLLFWVLWLKFWIFAIFSNKMSISTLPVIFLMKFCSSNFYNSFFSFFSKGWKVKYFGNLKINHHNFFSISSFGIY